MKSIFIAASPNTQIDDVLLAFRHLLNPFSWFSNNKVTAFEKKVSEMHNGYEAIAMDSARSAFYLLLKAYGVKAGDEVILPAFTCLVIANPVIWLGAKPVYVDVGEDFNIDLNELRSKVSENTKAILVQHTFGKPVSVSAVREIVGQDVKIIEDLAHSLGSIFEGSLAGTKSDAAVITFGIEKVISTVRGGMAITNNRDIAKIIRLEVEKSKRFSYRRVFVSLLNPIFWYFVTPFYYLGIGKATLGRLIVLLARMLGVLGNMIEKVEYKTVKPKWLPAKMPGALASFGLNQLRKLEKYNQHRRKVAAIYSKILNIQYPTDSNSEHGYLRFPLLVENQAKVLKLARTKKVVLGDWYKSILYAPKSSLPLLGYTEGEAAKAELFAKHIVNLPTAINVDEKSAEFIARLVKPYKWK